MKPITFCINTAKNELHHITLLLASMREGLSRKDHEILIYVENDNQGTVDFLKTQKKYFPNLKIIINPLQIPIGYARNINLMFEMATNDIVSYLQSDMVVCDQYDEEIVKHLMPNMVISSTRVEPPLHPPSPEKITYDFGLDPKKFDLVAFTKFAELNKKDLITDFWFAPFTLYKTVWTDIGGHDTLFRRSREDSDLLYRLVMNGVVIKQVWNAIVYHFTCTSSRGPEWWTEKQQARTMLQQLADSVEMGRFLRKWPSFKHDTKFNKDAEFKYPVSINIVGASAQDDLSIIHNYFRFNHIYVDNPTIREHLKKEFEKFHDPANELLSISNDDWKSYQHLYRTWNASDIFVDTPIITDDSILHINLMEQNFNGAGFSGFLGNPMLHTLNNLIHENRTENGEFLIEELNARLTINNAVNRIRENIKVINPSIQEVEFKII